MHHLVSKFSFFKREIFISFHFLIQISYVAILICQSRILLFPTKILYNKLFRYLNFGKIYLQFVPTLKRKTKSTQTFNLACTVFNKIFAAQFPDSVVFTLLVHYPNLLSASSVVIFILGSQNLWKKTIWFHPSEEITWFVNKCRSLFQQPKFLKCASTCQTFSAVDSTANVIDFHQFVSRASQSISKFTSANLLFNFKLFVFF